MPSHRGYQKKCSLKWAWLLTKKTKTPQTLGSHSQNTFLAGDSRSTRRLYDRPYVGPSRSQTGRSMRAFGSDLEVTTCRPPLGDASQLWIGGRPWPRLAAAWVWRGPRCGCDCSACRTRTWCARGYPRGPDAHLWSQPTMPCAWAADTQSGLNAAVWPPCARCREQEP